MRKYLLISFLFLTNLSFSQTAPSTQVLSFNQNFGITTFNSLPVGLGSWTVSSSPIGSQTNAQNSTPNGDATISATSNTQTTGGSYGYATSSNARFYIQTSSNTTNGTNQLVAAINTTGKGSITISYDIEMISANSRTIGVILQYRVGSSGSWINVTDGVYSHSSNDRINGQIDNYSNLTLPSDANNQSVVQLRWATWRGTQTGNSSGIAIDNISISGSVVPELYSFRSKQNGNWNNINTWEYSIDNQNWSDATISPNYTSNTITIQMNHIVTLTSNETVDQLTINGTLIYSEYSGSGLIINNGTGVDFTINGTFEDIGPNSVAWSDDASWEMGTNGTLLRTRSTSSNNWRDNYNNGISNIPSTANWIIRKTGSDSPTLSTTSDMSYPNLFIENNTSTTWTTGSYSSFTGFLSAPIIKGSLYIGGNGTGNVSFLNENTNSSAVEVNGSIVIKSGSTLRIYGTGFKLQEDFVVNGALSYDSDDSRRIEFIGSNSQTISGNGSINFLNLRIYKSSNALTLNSSISIENNLALVLGHIVSSSTSLLTLNDNATISGGSSISFIDGPLKKIGNEEFTFPIGKFDNFQPITITAPSEDTDTYTAEFFNSGQTNGSYTESSITNLSTTEYWNLQRIEGNSNIYVTISWNSGSSNNVAPEKMRVAYWNNTLWKDAGNSHYTGNTSSGTVKSSITLTSYGNITLANNVFTVTYQPPIIPSSRIIDTNLPVGYTQGQAQVSQAGSAVYSIPIFVSPGTAGVQPSLSIVYNSLSGNDFLGMGWSIEGLSSIDRTATTLYHDEFINAVDFDDNDRFSLNGQRLVMINGTIYGENNSEYRTEMESFSKITAYKSNSFNGVNPDYFKVEPKSGGFIEYGNSTSSKFKVAGQSDLNLKWLLNKVVDNNGNYMTYNYDIYPSTNEYVIKEINYTANDNEGINTYNSVKFYYEIGRSDNSSCYIGGSSFSSTLLLFKIEMISEGNIVRSYKFNYSNDFYTHLTEIIEYGKDGTPYNSTLLNYGDQTAQIEQVTTSMSNLSNLDQFVFIDVNGDGKSDAVTVEYDPLTGTCPYWKYYSTNSDGESFTLEQNVYDPVNYCFLVPGDFNGDGFSSVIKVDVLNPSMPDLQYQLYLLESNGSSLSKIDLDFSLTEANNSDILYRSADFDGDGRTELLVYHTGISSPNNDIFLYRVNNDNLELICSNRANIGTGHNLLITDFNGNSKQEVFVNNTLYEYDNTLGNFVLLPFNSSLFLNPINVPMTGDFNGDGKTDILQWENVPPSNAWSILLSSGTGLITAPYNCPIARTVQPFDPVNDNFYYVADYNGDNKGDILEIYKNGDEYNLNTYYFNGASFTLENSSISYNILQFQSQNNYPYYDINGDGNCDFFVQDISTGYGDEKILFFHKNEKRHLLKTVTNGFNQTTQFNYASLTDGEPFYTKSGSFTYPFTVFQAALNVVSSMIQPDGIGGNIEKNYTYRNAIIHKTGKGFLGFESQQNNNGVLKVDAENELHTSSASMLPSITTIKDIDDNLLKESILTFEIIPFANHRFVPQLTQNESNDVLANKKVIIQYQEYDSYNNATEIYNQYLSGSTIDETSFIENTYVANGSWCNNKVNTSIITKTRIDEIGSNVRDIQYTYDSNGNLLTEVSDPTRTKSVVTTYTRSNATGLPSKITVSSTGLTSRYIDNIFDSKFRNIIQKKNSLDQITSTEYDFSNGKILSTTDINDLTTTYIYDDFGRQVESVLPNDLSSTTAYSWCEDCGITNAVYSVNTVSDGAPGSVTYYDALNRKLKTEIDSYSGTIVNEVEYNNNGEVLRCTEPYFNNETPQWIEYTYDNGRVLTITQNSNQVTTYEYSDGTVSITDFSNRTSSKTYDATGKIIEANDNGGSIIYTYNNAGLLKDVNCNGIHTIMTYDDYGRQLTLNEPSIGEMSYEYNAFGEVETQTDARNNTYTMEYDELGRIITKSSSNNEDYTFSYVSSGNGIGQLSSIIGPSGNQTFQYDGFNHITQITETINSQQFVTQYEYNELGQNSSITYPSGFETHNTYDDFGHISEILNAEDESSIWKLESENSHGQITLYKNGNNFYTQKTYNSIYSNLQSITTGSAFNMSFSFDNNTGNLLSRTDNLRNLSETFTYDNLDRLTTMQVAGQQSHSMTYSNLGNITEKSLVGMYSYSSTKPYAVDEMYNALNIPALTQIIDYNSFNKVEEITEGDYRMTFSYGANQERNYTEYFEDEVLQKQKYFALNYEKTVTTNQTIEWTYINTPDGLTAIYREENGLGSLYYVCKDYLGSILALLDENGVVVEEYNYDAWGHRRYASNWLYNTNSPPILIERGFSGHEHLDQFGLINMNGRLYDPLLGRMLSPDIYVQLPSYSQNFNKYSYCLNNPLKYTDPSGDFIWTVVSGIVDFFVTAFIKGGLDPTSSSARNNAWRNYDPTASWSNTNKAWKIDKGMFTRFDGDNFGERAWDALKRFTWEFPQTIIGYTSSGIHNLLGGVKTVSYYGGATAIESYSSKWGAVTLGNYIIGQRGFVAQPGDQLFQHEYGHYIQSNDFGFYYLYKVGLPSLFSEESKHNFHPVEQDANARAFSYFSNNVDGFNYADEWGKQQSLWDRYYNPINGYDWSLPFENSNNQNSLKSNKVNLKWYDIMLGPGLLEGLINMAIFNTQY